MLPSAQRFIFQERLRYYYQLAGTSIMLASSWHFRIHTLWFGEFIGNLRSQIFCTSKMTRKEKSQLESQWVNFSQQRAKEIATSIISAEIKAWA